MQILKQSTAVDVLIGPFVDLTDGATAETGESPSVKLSKNGQTLAAKNDVTTPVHDADGYYNCELDATDTNTVGTLVLTVAASANALPVRHEYQVIEEATYDALYGASATGFNGSGEVTVGTNNDKTGYSLTQSFPTNFADLSITATTGRVDVGSWLGTAVTLGNGAPDVNIASTDDIDLSATQKTSVNAEADTALSDFFTSSAQLVDDIWDEVITGAAHNTANSAARELREVAEGVGHTGEAQAGASGSITLAAGEPAVTDYFIYQRVTIIDGTGAGQSRMITGYNSSTKVATVDRSWDTNPDSTSIYSIIGSEADLRSISGDLTAADNVEAAFDGTGGVTISGDLSGSVNSVTSNVTVGTNNDKTGYSLTQSFPTNFSDLAITASTGRVDINANNDKTGYSISGTKTTLDALNDISQANVNTEVSDVLKTDTISELTADPGATPTFEKALMLQYMALRNKRDTTASSDEIHNDAGTVLLTGTLSDDGTTFSKAKYA